MTDNENYNVIGVDFGMNATSIVMVQRKPLVTLYSALIESAKTARYKIAELTHVYSARLILVDGSRLGIANIQMLHELNIYAQPFDFTYKKKNEVCFYLQSLGIDTNEHDDVARILALYGATSFVFAKIVPYDNEY